jgi:hypothetical protein
MDSFLQRLVYLTGTSILSIPAMAYNSCNYLRISTYVWDFPTDFRGLRRVAAIIDALFLNDIKTHIRHGDDLAEK